jgi:hypothetical protein
MGVPTSPYRPTTSTRYPWVTSEPEGFGDDLTQGAAFVWE